MKTICVFGASRHCIAEKYFESAHRMGELLGRNGMDMVFGGGDRGLMGAAARGVRENGGRVIGVIPEKLNQPGIAYNDCDELLVTPTMHTRKATMENMSDGFIGLPGGFGTVEEILEVITLKQLGYMNAPIVLLNQDGFFDPLLSQFALCIEESFADRAYTHMYAALPTPEDAMAYLLAYTPAALPDKIQDVLR